VNRIALIARRADAFCARLNDGFAAVAILLIVLISVTALGQRLPSLLRALEPGIDPKTGISTAPF
jgi:hypothetical protein